MNELRVCLLFVLSFITKLHVCLYDLLLPEGMFAYTDVFASLRLQVYEGALGKYA